MKKFIFVFLFVMGFISNSFARIEYFYSTSVSVNAKNSYGIWSGWSDWEPFRCMITMNSDRMSINVYTTEPQEYYAYATTDLLSDGEDGAYYALKCVDNNGLKCEIRVRQLANNQRQLWIVYNDVMCAYNIEYQP